MTGMILNTGNRIMEPSMRRSTRTMKDLLWFMTLSGLVAAILRLWFGLGATTNLSDAVPWGLWKIFNMVGGVALSTSGFTIGFLVYVLKLERFRPFLKPAILIAFLGYGCSCAALLFDIGLPHRFWHPIFMWNINSFLFEVFWCVLLYFTVTVIELAPSIFEHLRAEKAARFLHRTAFWIVIFGISLSSLHHSSLGSLFLVTPQRLHPLWYSPWLPLFFIISAMGSGIMLAVLAKIFWARRYNPETVFDAASADNVAPMKREGTATKLPTKSREGPDMPGIRALSTIAAGILGVYLILKVIDLFVRGSWSALLAGTWESWLYGLELLIATVIPIVLVAVPRTNHSPIGISFAAFSAAAGLTLNRLNVGIFGYIRDAGIVYFPSLIEWAVAFGVIAAAILVFFFIAEHLPIFSAIPPAARSQAGLFRQPYGTLHQIWNTVLTDSLHRVSLIAVFAIPLAFFLMYPLDVSNPPTELTVRPSLGLSVEREILRINGDHAGVMTDFPHAEHQERLGDSDSCQNCHHVSLPQDNSTPCSRCHRKMNAPTVIFDHSYHTSAVAEGEQLGGIFPSNRSCYVCHAENSPKTATSAKSCLECHETDMFPEDSDIESVDLLSARPFREAMHETCVNCHTKEKDRESRENLDRCDSCHESLRPRETTSGRIAAVH